MMPEDLIQIEATGVDNISRYGGIRVNSGYYKPDLGPTDNDRDVSMPEK